MPKKNNKQGKWTEKNAGNFSFILELVGEFEIRTMEEKVKILVVDDDAGIGEMLQTLLEFYGFEVFVTDKPLETVSLIKAKDIDLVLLDMLISGVDGSEICATIRKDKQVGDTPVLMMSALHDSGEKCRKAGADDFIAKPFEMEDLRGKIQEVLKRKQDSPA